MATRWHEVPLPPLEGEVPNEREAEGFVRQQRVKNPQLRYAQQLPFQGSQGGYAAAGRQVGDPYSWRCENRKRIPFNVGHSPSP